MTYRRDADGASLSHLLPSPLPPIGTIYAHVQAQNGTTDIRTTTGSVRILPVLISLYGAAPTAAGKRQLEILLAWLHNRAKQVNRYPGLRVVECRSADDQQPEYHPETDQHYAHIRYLIRYQQGA